MALCFRTIQYPYFRQVLADISPTFVRVLSRNLTTYPKPTLARSPHHPSKHPAPKLKPTSDALVFGTLLIAIIGISGAVLYTVRSLPLHRTD